MNPPVLEPLQDGRFRFGNFQTSINQMEIEHVLMVSGALRLTR